MATEEDGEPRHPLLTDVVLEALVKVTSRSCIPTCRLVCKVWNYHFLPRFRNEFSVKISEWRSVEKLVDILDNCKQIPYSRFHISRISLNDPWLENVFELCGEKMHGLSLELTKDDIDICQMRELLLMRAPNLQEISCDTHDGLPEEVTNHSKLFPTWCGEPKLGLKRIHLRFSSEKKFHPIFIKQLLQSCPKLEEIHFRRAAKGNSGTAVFINALSDASSSSKWHSLSSLHLGQIENDCFQALTSLKEGGLKLKKFSFEYLTSDVRQEAVEEFLKSQCDNLEELVLNECFGNNDLLVDFPVMVKLKKLAVTAFDKSQIVPRRPVIYTTDFPCLETLEVYGWQNTFPWDIYFLPQVNTGKSLIQHSQLRKLQPPYRINEVHYINRLREQFPGIVHLDITSPSNEVLLQLWNTWTNLETLEVFLDWNNIYVDSAFTGLSHSDVDYYRKTSHDGSADFLEHPDKSMRNLKRLKRFTCETYEPWQDGEPEAEDPTCLLTDVTGCGVFQYMSQLQEISIARSDISPECVGRMCNQLPIYTHIDIRGARRQKLTA